MNQVQETQEYTITINEYQRKMLLLLAMVAQLHNFAKLFASKGHTYATAYDEVKQFRRMLHRLPETTVTC